MSEELHAAAIVAALNAELAPKVAYDIDDVPATPPTEYVEVSLTRRYGGEARNAGRKGATGWRIVTRAVSKSSVSNARLTATSVTAALENARLTIDGERTTPIEFEGADIIGPDAGWYSGAITWTYALKES